MWNSEPATQSALIVVNGVAIIDSMADGADCSIRVVFEALRDVDPVSVDDDSLAAVVLGSQLLQNWVEARSSVWLAELDQRGAWAADGSRSVTSWVEQRTHAPAARVATQAKLGRALRQMPATAAAAEGGELSAAHCRLLVSCRTAATEAAFARDEDQLVGWATTMRRRELNQVVRAWAAHADRGARVAPPLWRHPGSLLSPRPLRVRWPVFPRLRPRSAVTVR